jgi:dTDP-glucose 4,6-dehydratase
MRILVTGGAGFIGSNFVRYVLDHSDDEVVVLDKLTYAGNLENLRGLEDDPRYRFLHGDIADPAIVASATKSVEAIVNFAAESHVDRSILDPSGFITTDIYGPYVLLEASRQVGIQRFVQVSTDEVYGDVAEGSSPEHAPLRPRSPYSASKAGGELLVQAYSVTYGVPTVVTRGSNTFGPYQYPEKLIPVVITEALDHRSIPVYGDGRQVRDWLYVEDHCSGIDRVLRAGVPGEAYNIGGGNERHNIEVIEQILDALGRPRSLIAHVPDRPGHDVRYSVDSGKLHALGWQPSRRFEETLAATVRWYQDNEWWWRPVKQSHDYREYFERNYGDRSGLSKPTGSQGH